MKKGAVKKMKLEAKVVERISKKGNPYTAIEISIGTYKKIVFLNDAELALVNLNR